MRLGVVLMTVATLLVCQMAARAAADRKTLTVVCETGQVYPYLIGHGESFREQPGIAVEMVRLVADRLGMELVMKRFPWKRCLEVELKNGRADGAFQSSYLPEREAFGHYPMKGGHPDQDHMLFTQNYAFYRLKTSRVAWDGRKLTGFSGVVGIPPGYSVGRELKKLGLSYETSPPGSILKKMASGRLQLAALLEQEGDRLLVENPELNRVIEKVSPPLITKPYYLMLSHQFVHDNPKLADRIWQMVREVRLKEYPRLQNEYVHQHQ